MVLFPLEISSSSLACWHREEVIIQRSAWLRSTRAEWQPTLAQRNTIQLPKEGPVSQILSESDLAFQIPRSLCVHPFWVSGECGRGNDFLVYQPYLHFHFSQQIWGEGIKSLLSQMVRRQWIPPLSTLARLTCLYSVNFWMLLLLHVQTHQVLQLT